MGILFLITVLNVEVDSSFSVWSPDLKVLCSSHFYTLSFIKKLTHAHQNKSISSQCSFFIPWNIKNPEVFSSFQGIQKWSIGLKWVHNNSFAEILPRPNRLVISHQNISNFLAHLLFGALSTSIAASQTKCQGVNFCTCLLSPQNILIRLWRASIISWVSIWTCWKIE